MPSISDLKTINSYYHLILSSYQSFSMALFDIDAIREGKSIGYGIDGYDLCRYLFPSSFFRGRPNPHHEVIRSTWDSFFRKSDGEVTFGVISPFAILELLATIEERASGRALYRYLGERASELSPILQELKKGMVDLEKLAPPHQRIIEYLYRLLRLTEGARRILYEGKAIDKLSTLLTQGKIKALDSMIRSIELLPELHKLLSPSSEKNVTKALEYLGRKRGKTYSDYSVFYNKLDVYHYVLFDSIDAIIQSKGIEVYLSSSGILSRNSWLLTKYGKLPNDISGIPSDWSARSSDAPNYLLKSLERFHHDKSQARDFLEEGRALCRVILRDLQEIPEMADCLSSPTKRQRLLAENPDIKVRNKIPQAILRFQNQYYRYIVPEFEGVDAPWNDVPNEEIDLEELIHWISNPHTRSEEFREIASQIQKELSSLKLRPLDWKTYIAPLGETAFDILHEFDPGLDT